jgi:hypothetical protein
MAAVSGQGKESFQELTFKGQFTPWLERGTVLETVMRGVTTGISGQWQPAESSKGCQGVAHDLAAFVTAAKSLQHGIGWDGKSRPEAYNVGEMTRPFRQREGSNGSDGSIRRITSIRSGGREKYYACCKRW